MQRKKVSDLVSHNYTIVAPLCGTRTVESLLIQHGFLVVMTDEQYWGILTPTDIVQRPRLIVADCITDKGRIQINEDIEHAYRIMSSKHTVVLPVFEEEQFVGVLRAIDIGNSMLQQHKKMNEVLSNKEDEMRESLSVTDYLFRGMLNNISHEVRTPLNVIMGFSQLLCDDSIGIEDRKRYINHILEGGDRLVNAINSIFEQNKCFLKDFSEKNRVISE